MNQAPPAKDRLSTSASTAMRRAEHGGDPLSESPFPYYNVSTEKDWFSGTSGLGVTIPFTAWSTEDNGSWEVEAHVAHWLGKDNTPAAAAPCSVSTNHWKVQNASTVNVHVDTSAGQQNITWCELRLKSTKILRVAMVSMSGGLACSFEPARQTDSHAGIGTVRL